MIHIALTHCYKLESFFNIIRDIRDIFVYNRGFSGSGYWMSSTTTNPRCHGNEMWDKIGYNSAYMGDICAIFAYARGLSGSAIEECHKNSTTTNPRCYSNEIWDKIGQNSACIRDISEMLASNRGFWGSSYQVMSVKRTTLVAMATKFETKWPITYLVWEIACAQ